MKHIALKRQFAHIKEQMHDGRLAVSDVLAMNDELNGYAASVVILAALPGLSPRSASRIMKLYGPASAGV